METAFLRAKLIPAYREEFLRVLASKLRNEKVSTRQFIIHTYVAYVGLPQSFEDIERACDSGTDSEICQQIRELFLQKWFPIVEIWNSLKYFTIPSEQLIVPQSSQPTEDIYQEVSIGNYVCAFARATNTNVKILCKKIAQLRQYRKKLREWFAGCNKDLRSYVNLFLVSCAIQLLDPRPDCIEADYKYGTIEEDLKCPVDEDVKIKLLSVLICSAQIKIITSIIFGRQLVNSARKILNDISFESEVELGRIIDNSAIISNPIYSVNAINFSNIEKVAMLRIGTYICVNKQEQKYFVVHGPMSVEDAQKYINISNIARLLRVPRCNGTLNIIRDTTNSIFIAMHLPHLINIACMDEPNMLEAIEAMTDPHIILTKIRPLRVTLQSGEIFVHVSRAYVLNCLWHFIMNISVCGSASTDIIATHAGQVFSFNEYPHHASDNYVPGARIVHSEVLSEFLKDVIFYSTFVSKWMQKLRELAQVELLTDISQKWRGRAQTTNITAQYLFNCAERAEKTAQIWTSFAKSV